MDKDFSILSKYKLPDEQEEDRRKTEECKIKSVSPFYNKLEIPEEPVDGEEGSIAIRAQIRKLTEL